MDSYEPRQRTPSPVLTGFLIAIAIFLITFFAPFWSPHPHEKARQISCMSNMKQIGLAMLQYTQDSDGRLPPRQSLSANDDTVTWRVAIYPYIQSVSVFRCPSNPVVPPQTQWRSSQIEDSSFSRSYAVNSTSDGAHSFGPFSDHYANGFPLRNAPHPGALLMLVESTAAYSDFNVLAPQTFRWPASEHTQTGSLFFGHRGRMNVLYCDGHVKLLSPGRVTGADPAAANPWTVSGAPFSTADQAKATSVLEYGARQNR